MKKKIIIGVIFAILTISVILMLIPVHLRSGAFYIPIRIKSDVPLVKLEYISMYEGKSLEESGHWREIVKNGTGNYVATVSYVMRGGMLSEDNYTCARKICIRLSFDDGRKLSVICPLNLPDDNAEIHIDTTQ
ncbi:MAG: hypothetical protein H7A51_13470 [Akkermansiaceae bacterium]|nr:hypothetical protein [Akkermansiaceae bacterium]